MDEEEKQASTVSLAAGIGTILKEIDRLTPRQMADRIKADGYLGSSIRRILLMGNPK